MSSGKVVDVDRGGCQPWCGQTLPVDPSRKSWSPGIGDGPAPRWCSEACCIAVLPPIDRTVRIREAAPRMADLLKRWARPVPNLDDMEALQDETDTLLAEIDGAKEV